MTFAIYSKTTLSTHNVHYLFATHVLRRFDTPILSTQLKRLITLFGSIPAWYDIKALFGQFFCAVLLLHQIHQGDWTATERDQALELIALIWKSSVLLVGCNFTFLSDTTRKTTTSRRNVKRHTSYYCWCNNARWINCWHSPRHVTGKLFVILVHQNSWLFNLPIIFPMTLQVWLVTIIMVYLF